MQAGVDVPRAASHVLEAHRLERQLLGWTAGDRVEADVRQLLVEPAPRLATTLGVDDAWRVVGEAGGEAALEDVGRFHDVVVGGEDRRPPRAGLGVREKRDGRGRVGAEVGPPLQVLDGHAHGQSSTSGSVRSS